MTKLKDFKKQRRNRQLLLLVLRVLEGMAFLCFILCGSKTLAFAIAYPVRNLILMGMLCTIAALGVVAMLENLIEEVRHSGNVRRNTNVRLRRVEADGRRKRGQKIA